MANVMRSSTIEVSEFEVGETVTDGNVFGKIISINGDKAVVANEVLKRGKVTTKNFTVDISTLENWSEELDAYEQTCDNDGISDIGGFLIETVSPEVVYQFLSIPKIRQRCERGEIGVSDSRMDTRSVDSREWYNEVYFYQKQFLS